MKVKPFSYLYGIVTLLVAIAVSWLILAKNHYFYAVWYDHGGISQAIEKYAPQNRYFINFADTTRAERIRLFQEISASVHNQGVGLADISYTTKHHYSSTLLRQVEITHLLDVAQLTSFLTYVLSTIACLWLLWTSYYLFSAKRLPTLKTQSLGFMFVSGFIGLLLAIFGWSSLFKKLHIWVFPAENQWFFYYQDSLMSTLMWAPHLFTYIGVTLAVFSIIWFCFLLILTKWVHKKTSRM